MLGRHHLHHCSTEWVYHCYTCNYFNLQSTRWGSRCRCSIWWRPCLHLPLGCCLSGTNSLATGLIPGTYMVTIADANTCDTTISITVPNAPGVAGSLASSTNTSCFQICDGTAEATATDGTAPYSYVWSNGVNSAIHLGMCAGD
jgi:hypothetical protein